MPEIDNTGGIPQVDPTKENPMPKAKIDGTGGEVSPQDAIDPTKTSHGEYVGEVNPYSGLAGAINQYAQKGDANVEDKEDGDSGTPNPETKDDAGKPAVIEKKNGEEAPPATKSNLTEMSNEQLIEEVKKNQRFTTDHLTEIETLKSSLEKRGEAPQDAKIQKFIEGLKINPIEAWNTFKDDLKLPDVDLLKANLGNDTEEQLLQYQNNVLKQQIEKEFRLQEGEFEPNKDELYTPKTASYRFRRLSEAKEKSLDANLQNITTSETARLEEMKENQKVDIKHYADTYLKGDLEAARSSVDALNSIPEKIASGELKQSDHPFSMRNLLRGANYDTLVAKAVDDAQQVIISKFASKGLYLGEKDLPTNITNSGNGSGEKLTDISSKEQLTYSPMHRTIAQDIYND